MAGYCAYPSRTCRACQEVGAAIWGRARSAPGMVQPGSAPGGKEGWPGDGGGGAVRDVTFPGATVCTSGRAALVKPARGLTVSPPEVGGGQITRDRRTASIL